MPRGEVYLSVAFFFHVYDFLRSPLVQESPWRQVLGEGMLSRAPRSRARSGSELQDLLFAHVGDVVHLVLLAEIMAVQVEVTQIEL